MPTNHAACLTSLHRQNRSFTFQSSLGWTVTSRFSRTFEHIQIRHTLHTRPYDINIQVLSSSWDGWPFGHNRHGPKIEVCSPFWGGGQLRPHLAQCGLGRGLNLRTKLHLYPPSRLATTDMGRKLGGCAPLGEREPGPHLTQCGQGQGLHAC